MRTRAFATTDRAATLEEALAATGGVEELLLQFEGLAFLPREVESLMLLLPRPETGASWSTRAPVESMVCTM